jgi:hypothetical protein
MLEEAFGYTGHACWVAFHWERCGDALRYHDGTVSADGSWQAWLTFVRHRRIAPALAPYHFGNSEEEAVHWLLLGRETRTLWAGTSADVAHFLRQSASPLITSAALTVLLESLRERSHTPHDLQVMVAHAMRREHHLVTALQEWLDTQ